MLDVIGQKFGKLTVILRTKKKRTKGVFYKCRCECGKLLLATKYNLERGRTKSCGCFKLQCLLRKSTKHGLHSHPLYSRWEQIKSRCYNPKNIAFKYYGGRGIEMCCEWKNSFEKFLADMGNPPNSRYTIERKNVNEHYCKDNCRWATRKEQSLNKQNSRKRAKIAADEGETLDIGTEDIGDFDDGTDAVLEEGVA